MRRLHVLALTALTVVVALTCVSAAQAAPTDPFQYKHSFALSGITNADQILVNHQTGNLLVYSNGTIGQFDPAGIPVEFSATGSNLLPAGPGLMVVDNSGGPTQGNIYVAEISGGFGENFWSYDKNGNPIGSNPHNTGREYNEAIQSAGVTNAGEFVLFSQNYTPITGGYGHRVYDPAGLPAGPFERASSPANPSEPAFPHGTGTLDALGNYYADDETGGIRKYDYDNDLIDLGVTGLPRYGRVVIDPSTNDPYVRGNNTIYGVHYSDPLVKSTPFVAVDGIKYGESFAFDGTGQFLYTSEEGRIGVLHREPATAPIGVGQATVTQIRSSRALVQGGFIAAGAATSYHFEYGTDTTYGQSTPDIKAPLSLFPVSVNGVLDGLQPGTTYHLRLAATNSVGTTYSPDKVFKTYTLSTGGLDPCPNSLARKQTAAQALP
jgi:hypothetical protein